MVRTSNCSKFAIQVKINPAYTGILVVNLGKHWQVSGKHQIGDLLGVENNRVGDLARNQSSKCLD